MSIPLCDIEWRPAWRVIPSRFPPVDLFERVADPADLEVVTQLESMTNDRLRDQAGNLSLVAEQDRISGPGASVIMAAFTHLNPEGSRFTDGTFGVFYASETLDVAVAETKHHRERFLRATNEAPMELDMRVYTMDLRGRMHDIRDKREAFRDIYHPNSYTASQRLARELREQNSGGIIYHSVRCTEGCNSAVFRPRLLSNCRQERHLCYRWNGQRITTVYKKELLAH
ncbi:MAG: RES family NAD+ phosphorylase [Alphaproteobacteria bacterium]|nr:RES family NAD+ phosphorylase [Alphaproteobacteria bacterium]